MHESRTVTNNLKHSVNVDASDIIRMLQDNGFKCPHNGVLVEAVGFYSEQIEITSQNPLRVTWEDEEVFEIPNIINQSGTIKK